jgi:GNAT superfamily N-acetyltransferase
VTAIRPSLAADIFRLQEVERAAAELFRDSGLIDIDAMAVVSLTDHMAAIEAGLSLACEVDGRIAGFVIGEWQGADMYLHELDVDPAFQRRGVGAALVRAFIELARTKDARDVYLATFRDPPWNAPFYRKVGFADVSRDDYLPWMTALEEGQASFLDLSTRVFMKLRRG